MKNKIISFVLFMVISFNLLAVPLVLVAPTVVEAAFVTAVGSSPVGAAIAVGVGVYALYLNFKTDSSAQSTQGVKIQTTSAPRVPTAVEAAAGFTAGFPDVVPPSTGPAPSLAYYPGALSLTTIRASTPHDACIQYVALIGKTWFIDSGNQCTWYSYGTSGGYSYIGLYPVSGCTSGYIISGSVCVLSVANSVVRPTDGYCPIVRSGNTYAAANDPDCSNPLITPQFAPDGTFSIDDGRGHVVHGTGFDSVGNATVSDSHITPEGNTETVTTRLYDSSPATVGLDPPVVSGQKKEVTFGSGTFNDPAVPVNPAAPSVQMPTDYARNGEAAAAAAPITVAIRAQTTADEAWRAGRQARMESDLGVAPAAETINGRTVDLSTFSFNTYSFVGNSSCPAPYVIHTSKTDLTFSWQPFCDYLTYLKVLVIALAVFGGSMILMDQRRTA
jgi:hypothetical protein